MLPLERWRLTFYDVIYDVTSLRYDGLVKYHEGLLRLDIFSISKLCVTGGCLRKTRDIIDGQKLPADNWMRITGFETIRTRQFLISYKQF